jgi:predicted NBD/HSP70 family sugar kinase
MGRSGDLIEAPGSLEALRDRNRELVVGALRAEGALSRVALVRRTGLSRSTVSNVVADLIGAGLLSESPGTQAPTSAGRPAVPLALNAAAGVVIGIGLAHDGVRVAVADLGHTIQGECARDIDADLPRDAVFAAVGETVADALAAAGIDRDHALGAAIGIPGPVDRATGRVGSGCLVPALVGVPLAAELGAHLGLDVQVENDANLCVLAEAAWGAGAGADDVIYLKLSRGIGAGLMLGGRLHRGATGTAGEIGHTRLLPDGAHCRCGNRGCLETVAGAEAIERALTDRLGEPIAIATVIGRAGAGDTACRRALRDAGGQLGVAVAAVCNLVNPGRIIIGGELATGWSAMADAFRQGLDAAAIDSATVDVEVVVGALGDRAEMLGALALVLRDADRVAIRIGTGRP